MTTAPLPHAPAQHGPCGPGASRAPRWTLASVRALVRAALTACIVILACGPVMAPDDAVQGALDDSVAHLRTIDRASREVLGLRSRADVERELARIGEARQHTQLALTRLEATVRDAQGLRLLANVRDAGVRYQPLERSFERLLREGRIDDARHLLLGELRPVQLDYFAEMKKIFRHQERHRLASVAQVDDGDALYTLVALFVSLAFMFYVLGFALWQWLETPDMQAESEVRPGPG